MDWRTMSLDELERQYSPSSCLDHPIDVEIQAYIERSAWARAACADVGSPVATLRYGIAATNTIDVVVPASDQRPSSGAPAVLYFHGGYWQELTKRESFFPAADAISSGWAFAAVDYTLAPEASIGQIVAECRAAANELASWAPSSGIDPTRITLAGSSAGAHLAALVALDPHATWSPAAAVLVSGVFDLEPLIDTYVNDALGIDLSTAKANSPLWSDVTSFPPTLIAYGDNETEAFKRQSDDFARLLRRCGVEVTAIEAPDRNHFDVVLDLCTTDSPLGRHTQALVDASGAGLEG